MLNILLSSKLIESILLGFVIPYLLLYDKYENGKIITEVVDGQQRILSILALFLSPFCNSQGDLEYSKKNGYALKGLKILSELNGKKVNAQEAKNKLTEKTIQKILNTELYVSKTTDEKNINFSAVDHFIRLNKNAFTIKENTYRMWTLTADKTILDFEKNITEKYQEDILPRVNQKRVANMITMKLACFIFYKKIKTVFFHDFSNNKVSLWLNNFNSEKDKFLFSQPDVITENRNSYLKAFKETEEFYDKVHSFLEKTNQTIHELLHLKKSANFPSTSYYYLYVLIGEISKEDLLENSIKINTYLQEFFEKIRKTKMRNEEIFEHLNFASQQISIFDTCKKNEFREKIKSLSKDL